MARTTKSGTSRRRSTAKAATSQTESIETDPTAAEPTAAEPTAARIDIVPPEVAQPAAEPPDDGIATAVPEPEAAEPEPVEAEPVEPALVADPEPPEEPATAAERRTVEDAPAETAPEPPATEPQPQVIREVTVQKVGAAPLFLGGILTAGLGFLAAWYLLRDADATTAATLAAQADRIATLETRLADLPPPADLAPLEAAIAAAATDLGTRIDRLEASVAADITGFDTRLTAVERAPAADGTLAEAAIASWERELDTLRSDIAAQQARMQEIADGAAARLAATQAEAAEVEANAAAAARRAIAEAALARVRAAVEGGAAHDAPLADLAEALGSPLPAVLTETAEAGVPDMGSLRAGFPAAARDALAAARQQGLTPEDGGAVGSFLRNQLQIRSVAPRDGDDPDAVLSRAGAALDGGDLTAALDEITTLPDPVQTAMSGWLDQARTRAEALAEVAALAAAIADPETND